MADSAPSIEASLPREPIQLGPGFFDRALVMRRQSQFAEMRKRGRTVAGRGVVVSWLDAPDGVEQFGLICGKRYDKRAVQRNRARRLMREAYRLLRTDLERPLWMVMIARASLHGRTVYDVQADLLAIWTKQGLLK